MTSHAEIYNAAEQPSKPDPQFDGPDSQGPSGPTGPGPAAERLAATPLTILAAAVHRGVDTAQIEKLMELQERYERSQAAKAFNQGMADCQREMPLVLTDKENTHTRSRYAALETITKAIKPVYTRHGFSLLFGTQDSKLADHVRIVCDVLHRDGHQQQYWADIPLDGKGSQGRASAMNVCQATGSTISYGRRYLTCMIFNLVVADEDDDGQGSLTEEQAKEIRSLMAKIYAADNDFREAAFLAWLKVDAVEDLPQTSFMLAVVELQRRLKRAENK